MRSVEFVWITFFVLLASCGTPQKPSTSEPLVTKIEETSAVVEPEYGDPIRFEKDDTGMSAYYDGEQIYEDAEQHDEPDGEDECGTSWSIQHSPLSRVGPLFIYCWTESDEAACGYPTPTHACAHIHLTGGSTDLTDVVTEASVLEALKRDSGVGHHVSHLATLPEALRVLATKGYTLENYWFVEMPTPHTVTMLFEYLDHENSTDFIEMYDWLELEVKPRPEHLRAFRDAASGRFGFLENNAPGTKKDAGWRRKFGEQHELSRRHATHQ